MMNLPSAAETASKVVVTLRRDDMSSHVITAERDDYGDASYGLTL
jgi:hypothetical protein